MEDFLRDYNLEELIPVFAENQIGLENLHNLTPDLLKELIPKIGIRIRFLKVVENYKSGYDLSNLPVVTLDQIIVNSPSASSSSTSNDDHLIVPTENRTLSFCGIEELLNDKHDPIKNFPDFDLKTLLDVSPHGSRILNFYSQNDRLNDSLRNKLVDIIITHLYTYILQYRLTHSQYNILCSKILSLFPNELSQIYYKYGKTKSNAMMQAKGKLVYKAHNIIAHSPDKCYMRKRRSSIDRTDTKKIREITEDEENDILWLRHHREPWEEVLTRWNKTFEIRRGESNSFNTVSEFISHWPIIGDPRAYSLIEADFKYLHPGKELMLLSKWDLFFESILKQKKKCAELNTRDNTLQDFLNILDTNFENLSEDSKVFLQISLLPRLIPPRSRAKVGKDHWKFTTNESVEGLIVHVNLPGDIDLKIESQIKKAEKRKIYRQVQPYLLVEGPQISDVRNTYIVIDKLHFHVQSVLKGLDLLFKCFFALNIKYPVQSEYIWLLIQKVIYDIPIPSDTNTLNISDLLKILD